MKTQKQRLGILLALAVLGGTCSAPAQYLIGGWQGAADGWVDNGNGLSITDPANAAKYSFASGAVSGYGQSLRINQSGFGSNLKYSLTSNPGALNAFLNGGLLSFTFSVPDAVSTGVSAGFSQIFSLTINAPGYGYNNQPWANATATGDVGNNQSGMPNYYFWNTAPVRSQTVTLSYSSILPAIVAGGYSYLELIFTGNTGGGAPAFYYMNNVTISAVPEPSALALVGLGVVGCLFRRRVSR